MSSTMPRLALAASRPTDLQRAEAILAVVVFGAHKFLTHSDWSGGLGNWLEQLGVATGAGQARIFANDPAGPDSSVRSSLRAQWIAPGCKSGSPSEALQGVSFRESGCARWEEMLARGQNIVGNIEDCPASEQPILSQKGITSLAIVPVFVGPRWWGFIGFAECYTPRIWTGAEVNALSAAAGIYGAALERQEMGCSDRSRPSCHSFQPTRFGCSRCFPTWWATP